MTGESKIVQKDQGAPFLISGCKVADGVGTMQVTGVGINTEWGLLMASISEDTREETPLQVRLNGVATFIGIVGLAVAVLVLCFIYFSSLQIVTNHHNYDSLSMLHWWLPFPMLSHSHSLPLEPIRKFTRSI